ncbi:MAG: LysM peptidoglycan-binding domain-containing protein [Methylococcaceae bacterium]
MTFRTSFGLFIFLFSTVLLAAEIKLTPSHPNEYTVKQSDTLWDISEKFLQNPWQWSEVWNKNSKTENPNLIFPGDIIALTFVNGNPQLGFAEHNNGRLLAPRMREVDFQDAIKIIPIEAIAPFLSSPKIVAKQELDSAPYVVDFAKEHLLGGAGDRIYVRSIEQPKTLNYTVYREGKEFLNPETKNVLGYEANYIADAVLQSTGDPATLEITKSRNVIRKGDKLMPTQDNKVALNFFPRSPETQIKGAIISVLEGVSQIGQHNIVVINKGSADGLKSGHVLKIFQRGRTIKDYYGKLKNDIVTLPNEEAGKLMTFRVFENISYALVMTVKDAIHVSDYVVTPLN